MPSMQTQFAACIPLTSRICCFMVPNYTATVLALHRLRKSIADTIADTSPSRSECWLLGKCPITRRHG
jgi:hypothetical protein